MAITTAGAGARAAAAAAVSATATMRGRRDCNAHRWVSKFDDSDTGAFAFVDFQEAHFLSSCSRR